MTWITHNFSIPLSDTQYSVDLSYVNSLEEVQIYEHPEHGIEVIFGIDENKDKIFWLLMSGYELRYDCNVEIESGVNGDIKSNDNI